MKSLLDREDSIFDPPRSGCVLSFTGLPGGDGKIYDRSPYGNIGTITGATWVMLPTGLWCLYFDGTDDYVSISDSPLWDFGSGDFTLQTWVWLTTDALCGLMNHGGMGSGSDVDGWVWFYHQGVGKLWFCATKATVEIQKEWSPSVETWYLLTLTRKGTVFTLYVDAVSIGQNTDATAVQPSADTLEIGRRHGGNVIHGRLALPRIYNFALGGLEIQNHFDQERHLFGVWSR